MTILAAFNWDKKTDSISYMFVDKKTYDTLDIVHPIKIHKDNFKREALAVIQAFFDKIDKYDNQEQVLIEYKTYIPQYHGQHMHSEIVEKEFSRQLRILGLN